MRKQESRENLLKFMNMIAIAVLLLIGLSVSIILYMQKNKAYKILALKAQEWAEQKDDKGLADNTPEI